MTSAFYGPKVWVTDDPAGEWQETEGLTLPEGQEQALKRIWTIAPSEAEGQLFAGGDPAVLFESGDGGLT
ncbi:MAG: exo-alpha-sialidase, partial [Actinobacteria bacterium]